VSSANLGSSVQERPSLPVSPALPLFLPGLEEVAIIGERFKSVCQDSSLCAQQSAQRDESLLRHKIILPITLRRFGQDSSLARTFRTGGVYNIER
jgi:hypothetical protein